MSKLIKERSALELLAQQTVSADYYYELLDCLDLLSNEELNDIIKTHMEK